MKDALQTNAPPEHALAAYVLALAPDEAGSKDIKEALEARGYEALAFNIGAPLT